MSERKIDPVAGYAGDVAPETAWELLRAEPSAKLVDVRTDAEWKYVGLPDLSPLGKRTVTIAWKTFPQMARNPEFEREVERAGIQPSDTVLLLCRSGQRSADAARALTERGFERAYNVAEGFEGDKDARGHRGQLGGWKARDLPWVQD
jgi:rhodanese-related sulfurtransferase